MAYTGAMPSTSIHELPTPACLLSEPILERNLAFMSERAQAAGVLLRPHCKTHKCAEIARRATRDSSGAITVSTLAEAAYFAAEGFRDITYAVGFAARKLARVDALLAQGVNLGILTDNVPVAQAIAEAAKTSGYAYHVWIEIDCGDHRGGVKPESEALVAVGRILHDAEGVHVAGVLTHGGHSYAAASVIAIEAIAEDERLSVVRAGERLEAAGIPCPGRSVGSTPTMVCGQSFEGVTEIRPGVYAIFDLMMEALGVCRHEDIAVSVLSTVIGHQLDHGHIITDGGSFSVSRDTGFARPGHPYGKFGLVREPGANRPWQDFVMFKTSQEHGWIRRHDGASPFPFDQFPIGSRVRVLPHHSCEALNCYDRFYVLDESERVVAAWPRIHGW